MSRIDQMGATPDPPQAVVSLAIVIGTYDRLERLRSCVESIRQHVTVGYQLYITDAGSTDGTAEYLERLQANDPRVTALLVGKRIGQARALNQVFERIQTEFTCWLSDDNVLVNDALDTAVDVLRRQPRIGMIGLKVKDVRGQYVDAPYIGGISSVGVLNVNQGVVRTSILHGLGGFLEVYHDYGIDPDLTTRILLSGWDVAYTRAVAIHHYREWHDTSDPGEVRRRAERRQNALAIYDRCFRGLMAVRNRYRFAAKRIAFRSMLGLLRRLGIDRSHHGACTEKRRFWGYSHRDWFNVFNSRFISLWDWWRYRNQPFHLVQHGVQLYGPQGSSMNRVWIDGDVQRRSVACPEDSASMVA